MPRLVLVNGMPSSGKSTLARRYAEAHPLSLCLDVDVVRSMVGAWSSDAQRAGLAARALALAMARTHLAAGHDVVVPQLLGRAELLLRLEALAGDVGASFHEVVLVVGPEESGRRLAARARAGERPEHVEAAEHLRRLGGEAELSRMHAALAALVATRPGTVLVRPVEGQVDQAYADLVEALERGERTAEQRGAGRPSR